MLGRMNKHLLLFLLGAGVLAGCTAARPGGVSVHEVQLYGSGQQRLVWVYGDVAAGETAKLQLDGQSAELRRAAGRPAAPLLINSAEFARLPLTAPAALPKVTRTAQGLFDVQGGANLAALYYTDGRSWYQLGRTAGSNLRAAPVTGLEGAGALTPELASALTRSLGGQGELAVGVLSRPPAAPLKVQPQPQEHRVTALSVVRVEGTSSGGPAVTSAAAPAYTVVAQGNNAAATGPAVRVATTAAEAQALYNLAYARQTAQPAAPDLSGHTLVGIFMGTRNTGGYGLEVQDVTFAGGRATVQVRELTPRPDMLTTQALTSPWVIVQLQGRFSEVTVEGLGRSAGIGGAER